MGEEEKGRQGEGQEVLKKEKEAKKDEREENIEFSPWYRMVRSKEGGEKKRRRFQFLLGA